MSSLLVADCNPAVQQALKDVLPEHEIFEADNGEVVIDTLTNQNKIDLLIIDVEMPITDGWEVLEIIRDQYNGWPDLRIIVLTVQREPKNIIKAWVHGVSFYITKPFSPARVCECVNLALVEPVPNPNETLIPVVV